jgi:hypothetical protein
MSKDNKEGHASPVNDLNSYDSLAKTNSVTLSCPAGNPITSIIYYFKS